MATQCVVLTRAAAAALQVGARVVQYRKHKNDNKYNYWLTGHQSVLKLYNDLRVQQVGWGQAC
jgi:hypothetical protein